MFVCFPLCSCACYNLNLDSCHATGTAFRAKNVPDARMVISVHAYRSIDAIPSELHPNARLLDEAFPTITVE